MKNFKNRHLFLILLMNFFFQFSFAYGRELNVVDSGLYSIAIDDSDQFYFVMERLDQSNLPEWQNYAQEQLDMEDKLSSIFNWDESERINEERGVRQRTGLASLKTYIIEQLNPYREVIRFAGDPLSKFEQCLKYYNQSEIWIAYVLNHRPHHKFTRADLLNVEMAMAILTQPGVPFQLHMGMSRSVIYLRKRLPVHSGLSVRLHAFAARVMLAESPEKRLLVTTPLTKMSELITRSLPAGAFSQGSQEDGGHLRRKGDLGSSNFQFQLFENQGSKEIFSIQGYDALRYGWFFHNSFPSEEYPYLVVDLEALAGLI